MSTYHDSQRPPRGRQRSRRLLAGGLVAGGLVVGAAGLGGSAAAYERGGENAAVARGDSAGGRSGESRVTPVPCDSAKLIAALVRVNAEGGGTLRLAPKCTYTLTDAFHQPDQYDGGIRDAREAADSAENPGEAEKPPRNPADDKAGLPVIYHPVTIEGEQATIERARKAEAFRFFTVRDGGELTLRNVRLVGGHSDAEGGAVHVVHGASALIERVTAVHNTSSSMEGGGGALFNDGNMVVRDSTLVDNHAYGSAGKGGGLLNNGVLTLHSSTFAGNSAAAYGGGLGNYQAAAEVHTSTFEHNSAAQGGGLASFSARTRVSDSKVVGNKAGTGGGIANSDALIFLRGMEIRDNLAIGDGGGISTFQGLVPLDESVVSGNTAHGSGGGIHAAKSNLLVRDSTVRSNHAIEAKSTGGGIAVSMGRIGLYRSLVVENQSTLPAGGLNVDRAQATLDSKTVVAENQPTNCLGSTSPVPHCFR
ncbi:membrane protein [Salinispora tropica]|uniref:Polymorphic membrane protein, Chlamydia n=1 Tax=Salinispora tropica (strain ATCC BAA-916 / DSM 44818 / JCM 13857 / NBRC 105044 / CNB-440) TaxID=369723 RepID=A4X7V7_SALTO|nr:membrane protein [Salinispora tropica]ABP54957.1 Polymorphic membrane protein, Chlamydia [Salinispora tropica CNB-440]